MEKKRLLVGALAATALTLGSGAAMAAQQAPETTADGTRQEEQAPSYKGSIAAPEERGENGTVEGKEGTENEAAAAQQLQGLAKIDQKAAEDAALQAVPGTVEAAELGDENGYLVWEVEVQASDGTLQEVKVDAGNGQVLAQESEANESAEGPEGSEANEAPEAGEATS